jgi:hypothetical protein
MLCGLKKFELFVFFMIFLDCFDIIISKINFKK